MRARVIESIVDAVDESRRTRAKYNQVEPKTTNLRFMLLSLKSESVFYLIHSPPKMQRAREQAQMMNSTLCVILANFAPLR